MDCRVSRWLTLNAGRDIALELHRTWQTPGVQPWSGDANAHMKDGVETHLNREVCRGAMPLAEAQRQIATDWLSVYRSEG